MASVTPAHNVALADQILTHTYPLVQDPKLLLSVCARLDDAGQAIIAAADEQDLQLPLEHQTTIATLRTIMQQHKDSPLEFRRKQKLVICATDLRYTLLTQESVKKLLAGIRVALHHLDNGRSTA